MLNREPLRPTYSVWGAQPPRERESKYCCLPEQSRGDPHPEITGESFDKIWEKGMEVMAEEEVRGVRMACHSAFQPPQEVTSSEFMEDVLEEKIHFVHEDRFILDFGPPNDIGVKV